MFAMKGDSFCLSLPPSIYYTLGGRLELLLAVLFWLMLTQKAQLRCELMSVSVIFVLILLLVMIVFKFKTYVFVQCFQHTTIGFVSF